MEAQELFRRLGAGARFDVQRFGRDARRFGVRSCRGGGGLGGTGRGPTRLSGAPARSHPLGAPPRALAALWRRSGSSPLLSEFVTLCLATSSR